MFWPSFLISPHRAAEDPLADPSTDLGEPHYIPMDQLQPGQCGVVHEMSLGPIDSNRLKAMGICPGRRVWLVRSGDPMIVKVMRSRVGLAAVLAEQVTVEVCTPRDPSFLKKPAIRLEKEPGP